MHLKIRILSPSQLYPFYQEQCHKYHFYTSSTLAQHLVRNKLTINIYWLIDFYVTCGTQSILMRFYTPRPHPTF